MLCIGVIANLYMCQEAMIFGKHAVGNQGKSSGHGENSLLDIVYLLNHLSVSNGGINWHTPH